MTWTWNEPSPCSGSLRCGTSAPTPTRGPLSPSKQQGGSGHSYRVGNEHATVPEQFDPMDVTLDEAVRFLAAKRELMALARRSLAPSSTKPCLRRVVGTRGSAT